MNTNNDENHQLLSIILYTDMNPHIKKCLRDDDYWTSLHERSGFNWKIFAVKPKPGKYDFPDLPPGFIGLMVPVWHEPADNKPLIRFLGLDDTKDLPIILFYKIQNDAIVDEIYVKIDGVTEIEVYSDLENIISVVVGVIDKEGDLYENVKSALKKEKIFRKLKKYKKKLSDFNSLIPGIF